ncbi:MAG: LpxD N-terminal domain-containing protein [Litorimonas sp.]
MIDPRFYTLRSDTLSLSDLCALIGLSSPDGTFGDTPICKPADLATSEPGDIAFLESKRHASALETARGSACFTTDALAEKVAARNIIPIISPAPKYHLAKATELLVQTAEGDAQISPSAKVDPTARIGAGVVIGDGVEIGAYCVISHAVIGQRTKIAPASVIGGNGFGVAVGPGEDILPVPHVGRVVIGERVRIGSNVCVDRGQLGDTVIGDDCQIDNLVQIGHNCILERGCMLAGRVGLSGSCHLHEGVMMGGSAGLADHITVGKGARLAAFAGVMHDVPAGETWSGIPAMPIRQHMKIVAHTKRAVTK